MEKELLINEVVNIGNDVNVTILQLAELIIHITGSRSEIEFLPPLSEGDMTRRQPDTTRMLNILNHELIPLEQGIRKILDSGKLFMN